LQVCSKNATKEKRRVFENCNKNDIILKKWNSNCCKMLDFLLEYGKNGKIKTGTKIAVYYN